LVEATRQGGSIGWTDLPDRRRHALMKFAAALTRSLHANMQAELRDLERAAATGTRDAGRNLRTEHRDRRL
jgi:hypothetical protein